MRPLKSAGIFDPKGSESLLKNVLAGTCNVDVHTALQGEAMPPITSCFLHTTWGPHCDVVVDDAAIDTCSHLAHFRKYLDAELAHFSVDDKLNALTERVSAPRFDGIFDADNMNTLTGRKNRLTCCESDAVHAVNSIPVGSQKDGQNFKCTDSTIFEAEVCEVRQSCLILVISDRLKV